MRGCWSIRPRGTSAAPMSAGSGEWTMDSASPDPVPAPVTTIAWRLAHIIVSCLGYRVGWHFGGQDVDSRTFAYAGTADEALKQLDETYGRCVSQLPDPMAAFSSWVNGACSRKDRAIPPLVSRKGKPPGRVPNVYG